MTITLAASSERFLEHCRIAKRLSANTLRAYGTDLATFVAFAGAGCDINHVDRDLLRGFARLLFDDRGLKEASVKRRMAALKVMFHWLEREELVDLSPFHRLDLAVRLPRRLPRALSVGEIRCLLETAEVEVRSARGGAIYVASLLHFIVVTLVATGLRIGELCAVTLGDVDMALGTLRVRGKGNRERTVYLPKGHAMATLGRYLRVRSKVAPGHGPLLVAETGQPVTPQSVRRILAALALRAGLTRRITPHMLRHTAATQLIEAGVDIRFVQKLLGHASIATTQIYTQVSDASLRATLERVNTVERIRSGRAG
jgi:integrase/recombinase XerD